MVWFGIFSVSESPLLHLAKALWGDTSEGAVGDPTGGRGKEQAHGGAVGAWSSALWSIWWGADPEGQGQVSPRVGGMAVESACWPFGGEPSGGVGAGMGPEDTEVTGRV